MIRKTLGSIFNIRDDEYVTVQLFFLYLTVIGLMNTLGATVGDSLFLAKVGEEAESLLPWAYIAIAIATAGVTWLISPLLSKDTKVKILIIMNSLLAGSVLVFAYLLNDPEFSENNATYLGLIIWLEVIGLLSLTFFFSFMGDYFTSRDARRLYGYINGGFPVGTVIMGLSVGFLLSWFSPQDLLYISACFLVLLAILPAIINSRAQRVEDDEAEEIDAGKIPVSALFKNSFVALILLMILADLVYFVVIDFQMKTIAGIEFKNDAAKLTAFFGKFFGIMGFIQLFIQFVLAAPMLKKLGILRSLIINAVLAVVATIAFMIHPILLAIAAANMARYTFSETIDIPGRELLFFPLPGRLRQRAQALASGALGPIGQGVGGLILLICTRLLDIQALVAYSYIAIIFAGAWVATILLLMPRYKHSLESSLKTTRIAPTDLNRLFESSEGPTLISKLLSSDSSEDVLVILPLLKGRSLENYYPILEELLQSDNQDIVISTLQLLADPAYSRMSKAIKKTMLDGSGPIASQAAATICQIQGHRALEDLTPYTDGSKELRIAIYSGLARFGGLDSSLFVYPRLEKLLHGNQEKKLEAIQIIGQIGGFGSGRVLKPLLEQHSDLIRHAVLEASFQVRDPFLLPQLIRLLEDPDLQNDVMRAIQHMPPQAAPAIMAFVVGELLDDNTRIMLIRTLNMIGGRESLEALEAIIRDPSNRNHGNLPMLLVILESAERLIAREALEFDQDLISFNRIRLYRSIAIIEELRMQCGAETDPRIESLLHEHNHLQVELLFTYLKFFYERKQIEKIQHQIFSNNESQKSNALELLEVLLNKEERVNIVKLIANFIDRKTPVKSKPGLTELKNAINLDPWAKNIAYFHLLSRSPEREKKGKKMNYTTDANLISLMSTISFLKDVELFQDIPANYLASIAELMKKTTYYKGEILFHKGDAGDVFHIVQSGRIQIDIKGTHVYIEPGEGIGEMSLLDGEPRSATAKIAEDSTLLSLTLRDFNHILNSHTSIARSMLRIMSIRLRSKSGTYNAARPQTSGKKKKATTGEVKKVTRKKTAKKTTKAPAKKTTRKTAPRKSPAKKTISKKTKTKAKKVAKSREKSIFRAG